MIGPIFGGLFVTYWSWRGIFFVNVPIGALLLLGCLRYVPRDKAHPTGPKGRLDVHGMLLLGAGVLTLMVGISELGEAGVNPWSPVVVTPIVVGLIAVALFARHIRRISAPFVSPRLIAGRGFGAVNIINVVYGGVTAGLISLVPLYALDRYHIHALGSGTLLVAEGAATIVMAPIAVLALRRTGYHLPLYIGSGVAALGIAALAMRPFGISSYAWLAIACAGIGLGTGFASPASRNAGLQLAPEESASIAALRSTGRQIGQIVAVSITSAIVARSVDPGMSQAFVDLACACLLVLTMPVITRVVNHRGAW